jgi:hypothetical protein
MRHLILAAALLVAGCSPSPEGTVSGMTEADGYTFTRLGGGNVMTCSRGSGLNVTPGEHVVGVDRGKLSFDARATGAPSTPAAGCSSMARPGSPRRMRRPRGVRPRT